MALTDEYVLDCEMTQRDFPCFCPLDSDGYVVTGLMTNYVPKRAVFVGFYHPEGAESVAAWRSSNADWWDEIESTLPAPPSKEPHA